MKVGESRRQGGEIVDCWPWRWANARASRRRCGFRPRTSRVSGPSVLRAAEHHPRRGRFRPVRGGAVSAVLCAGDGAPEPAAGTVLPVAAARLLRGARLGAWHRLARGRFARGAQLRRAGPRHRGPGSFDDLAHAALDRRGDPSGRLHVGAGAPGGRRAAQGADRRRWRRTPRCAASCGATPARAIRSS